MRSLRLLAAQLCAVLHGLFLAISGAVTLLLLLLAFSAPAPALTDDDSYATWFDQYLPALFGIHLVVFLVAIHLSLRLLRAPWCRDLWIVGGLPPVRSSL